jgi:hypothetical protein
MARLNTLLKSLSHEEEQPSGAKAPLHFQPLRGTSKLVPFPFY